MAKVLYVAKLLEYDYEAIPFGGCSAKDTLTNVKTLLVGSSREEVVSELIDYIMSEHLSVNRQELEHDLNTYDYAYGSEDYQKYVINEVKVLNLAEAL